MVGATVGNYRVIAEIGRGGMGVVYRAEHLRLGRHVALKFLPQDAADDGDALERFEREARAASALNHPHICTIHDIDTHEGRPFIVMELLEGQTVRERIAPRPLDLEAVLTLGMQVAEALDAAHAKGIVHRDIKSANIFLSVTGQAKVLDFGLAKLVDPHGHHGEALTEAPATALVTGPGTTMGTAAYMSPEQVRGEPLDARTDIFSLAVVLYEAATGRLPFQGASAGAIFDGILNKAPVPASQLNRAVPAEFDRILDKALEKDRELRYQSARELRADIARLRRDTGSGRSATTAAAPSRLPRSPSRVRGRAVLAAAAILAAAALAAAAYRWWPRTEPPASNAARILTRLTFDEGLQTQPRWSPDGRFVAYASDKAGNFDIWVQPLGGGRAVQVTNDPAHDWMPAWSPDGNNIAFRSERDGGGIFVAPAFGGRERRVSTLGYHPEWSPDSARLLFYVRAPLHGSTGVEPRLYVANLSGGAPERILADSLGGFANVERITWLADGQRLAIAGDADFERGGLWVVPVSGGTPVLTEVDEAVASRMKQEGLSLFRDFEIAPDGTALYSGGLSQGVENLWRFDLDPKTLRWIGGPHRLTTGRGPDGKPSVSRDGRIAFLTTAATQRLWSIPREPAAAAATVGAQPLTSANVLVSSFDVSRDGNRMTYVAERFGKDGQELWSQPLDGGEPRMLSEAPHYWAPRISADGSHVVYRIMRRHDPADMRVAWTPLAGAAEHELPKGVRTPFGWSADGRHVLHNCLPPARFAALCLSPREATSTAETKQLLVDAANNLWQGQFSPDGRWIIFNAQSVARSGSSVIGVVSSEGGAWRPLTDPSLWADKPRWAPDGKTIYFISNKEGLLFDVWGIRIDPASGTRIGEAFRVTKLDSPGRMLTGSSFAELGVTATRLVVPITEQSGGIWVLDNASR